ncbi:hypothetical protein [Pseudomonas protegens]|uniref:hypothetical protein n=1 Tax=Pseudomonas protegens TaxID=380021 RepID=UPI000F49CFD2|nr:hypothetical protein [Pseudomonas protegens]ROL87984.1 hypothetical protein BK639_21235 [Pseudomonas protegens]ROL94683.1 hypothetical protein BK640_30555 [Pseudomonas protegens]ROM04002.1 hypothetical protein BK642_20000 [Pseudomonas protegens]ROM05824.1 hypothetical protein BK641_13650 [Pseudomonas protegens]
MPIYADGATITGNGKGGVLVIGDDVVSLKNAVIKDNDGLGIEQRSVSVAEQIGLSNDIDPQEFAEFLRKLVEAKPSERPEVVFKSGLVPKIRALGLVDLSTFINNALAVASNPSVTSAIKLLFP